MTPTINIHIESSGYRQLSDSLPEARRDVLDGYWKFATERQEIFFSRLWRMPKPWTSDNVLSVYKFTNVYRSCDRVSQYLIRKVIYHGDPHPDEVMLRILLFKFFNRIETWEGLIDVFGPMTIEGFSIQKIGSVLNDADKIFSAAYIIPPSKAFGHDRKHMNYLELIKHMVFDERVQDRIVAAKSLAEVYEILVAYPMIGPFIGYQLTTDVNYSKLTNFDENSFTVPGVGAVRGIAKMFDLSESQAKKIGKDVIMWMVNNQENELYRLGLYFKNLWGRPMKAIDCQNVFCEFDKYSRVTMPQLNSFGRKKIKQKFSPSERRDIEFFFPPKWGINSKVDDTTRRVERASRFRGN